jgi:hypothetical protein
MFRKSFAVVLLRFFFRLSRGIFTRHGRPHCRANAKLIHGADEQFGSMRPFLDQSRYGEFYTLYHNRPKQSLKCPYDQQYYPRHYAANNSVARGPSWLAIPYFIRPE